MGNWQYKKTSHDVKFLRNISLYRIIEGKSVRTIPSKKNIFKKHVVISTKIHANEFSYSIASDSRSMVEYKLVYIFMNISIKEEFLELLFIHFNENKNTIKNFFSIF